MEARSTSVVVEVHAPICAAAAEILTPDSLRFVGYLCHKFEDRRRALLNARASRALEFDSGALPHFDRASSASSGGGMSMREPHSHATDDPHWRCAPIPEDVKDRRVEITGPVDRKMVINGLNSGANVYMADFEGVCLPCDLRLHRVPIVLASRLSRRSHSCFALFISVHTAA
jgi:malate synthase